MDGYFFMILTSTYSIIQLSSKQQSFATPKIIHIFGIFNHVFIMPRRQAEGGTAKSHLNRFQYFRFQLNEIAYSVIQLFR